MKPEPMALATCSDFTSIHPIAPEARAYGSGRIFIRPPHVCVAIPTDFYSMNPADSTNQPAFQRGVDGLLVAIAQDATSNKVLMVAWMNAEAFQETIDTGYATYYSRSRKRLWRKGEESGHRQKITGIFLDCDQDTILLTVDQTGAACHEGYESCFFRKYENGKLSIISERLVDPKEVY
jgi:phosphoribosyl-AMP cyclohydrolase